MPTFRVGNTSVSLHLEGRHLVWRIVQPQYRLAWIYTQLKPALKWACSLEDVNYDHVLRFAVNLNWWRM